MKALWFSGGCDSMACLLLMRDELQDVAVIWANTGKNYPEALGVIERARNLCPRWHEIRTDRARQWLVNGLPSGLVPIDWTVQGQVFTVEKSVKVQSYLQCCYENISGPLMQKTKALECDTVITGQRTDETRRGNRKSGDTVDGITFLHPIEGWTKAEVMAYLATQMEIPAHYAFEHSSLDCYDCTAYVENSIDRVSWMQSVHPQLHAQYAESMQLLRSAIDPVSEQYSRA
jgi:3'-phosphoadenosine 5'-phosphosulfate sulfotransferase (PAPS reductase)/FAD synthetase